MATSLDYANWLRNNQDKRGTPNYKIVLQAYQEAALEELRAAQPPAPSEPAAKPESGFLPALRAGATELGGGISALLGKVGLKDEAAAQAEYDEAQRRAKEIFAPTQAGWTEAPGTKFLELLGGSVPYMAAPLAAGVAAAALPLTGPAALATTLGAAGLTSAAQFTATNLSRQMEEGKKLAETDLGAAALAAVPQAALDTLSMRMIPGIGRIFGQAGIKITAETAKEIAEQGLKKTLIDYTAATGKTMGAEGLTEAAQQVLERAQAGLSLTDPKAREEYFESFLGGAVLGGTLAVPGRYYERGKAQGEARTLLEGQEAAQRKAARDAEEAAKNTPEYLLQLEARYKAAVAEKAKLDEAAKKPAEGADPATMVAYRDAVRARNKFAETEMAAVSREYVDRKKEIDQLKERRRVEGMTPFEYMMEQAQKVPAMDPKKLPFTTEDTEIFPTIARPPRVEPLTAYAKSRIALANEQQLAAEYSLKDKDEAAIRLNIYTDYLLQDPVMAQRLVNSKTAIPDVSARESNAILSSIKLKLQERYKQQAGELAAERPDLAPQVEDVDTFAPWKQAIEAEERLREEEAVTAAPVRKEEAVISPEREALIQERETARRRYFAAAATYEKARGTPDGVRALQQLLAARRQYEELFPASAVSQLPQPTLLPETEAQLNKALEATVGEAPSSAEELEARVQRMADTRKTAIAKVAENAAELDQYERLTRYMGTKQGLSEIARTPEMAEAAKRRMTPMLEQAQASRNEAIAAAIQEIKLQRDLSGLVPLGKTDAELQDEFRDKLNRDLQQAKGKDGYTEKRRQEAVAQQLQRINNRIQQLESGDRVGRLLGYASAFRGQQERTGELSNLYKAYKNLSMQQGLTPQAVQLNRTLQNLIDFYTVGGGAAKPRLVAKGPREAKRELVLGERAFTGYEPTIEGTEVRYDKPRKKAAFKATPEEQALVEDMRARELAALNEAADRQYTPETSDRAKKQILDELRARIDGFNAPATQEEVAAAQAQAAPQDQGTGDLFAAATERAQTEFQAAGERRTAARSEFGRAMAGMRGKSAIMDQAQRLAEAFGKDLGLRGTYAEAKEKLTKARTEKRAAETEFTEKEQEVLRAAADDALIAQREAEAANRAANNTVDAITARLEVERKTPTVEVRTPPRAMVLLRKMAALQALIGEQKTKVVSGDKVGTTFAPVTDVGLVKSALDQAVRAANEGESWASDIEQVQAHMSTLEKYLSRREAQGRLLPEAKLLAKQWYRKLAEHEAALRRPMYGAGQLTPDEIRNYTQRRLSVAQAEYDRIKLQIDGLHRQLLDTEVAVAKREVDRINGDINKLIARTERREGADLANQELQALMAQHKDAVANLNAAQKTFDERKKAESVPFTRKSPAPELEQWMKGAQERFEQSVQRFKDKQAALERQATAPAGTVATTATERRVEAAKEAAAKAGEPQLETQLRAALDAQKTLKKRGSKKQRKAIAEKIADLRKRLGGASLYGEEYYETSAQQQADEEKREEAELLEAREAGKEETTRAGRRKAAKAIFGVQRTIAETGEVPQAVRDGNKLDKILKSNRQAFEMAVEQGFKSTAIRPQKRGKSATPERVMRTPIEGIAYRLRQEIVEKMAAPQTKEEKKALTELRERLYGLEEAINTAPVTVEERRRTARAIWAKLPKDMRSSVVDTFNGRTESGRISVAFFDRFADALETTIIRQRLGQPLSQAPVTTMTKAELAPIQAETEERVAATLKATEELRQKYYEQKEKELADKARLQGQIDEATQRQIEKEAKEFADRVVQRIKEEEARAATRRITEPMRRKPTANVPGEIPSQFARGVEVETPDLSSEQVKALEDNDVSQALALLSTDKSADRVHRAVAQRLAQLLDATDVEVKDTLVDDDGKPVLGQAFASGKTIRLSRDGGLNQEILLHESTHAAAERVLSMPEADLTPMQLAAKRELQALHAAVKRDPNITSTEAKGSLSEFVAEVMSNRNLQQQLAKKPWRVSDALRAFKSIVLRLLGIKDTESMLGAAIQAVDAIFLPTSVQAKTQLTQRQQYSQKDIAALHDGSNSMRQFAENFPQYIKQKDRTPEDVDRIGGEYLKDMVDNPEDYVATAEPEKLDYKSDTIMSDGTVFDPDNPLHLVEATPTTFVALEAQKDEALRKREAKQITRDRQKALLSLLEEVFNVSGHYPKSKIKGSYTLPEKALVAKAASKYSVQSTPEGRLKLVTIDSNNRHPVSVVSKEAVDAVIKELRAGKNLKTAFLDGMQKIADQNAARNSAKNGWQKFETPSGTTLTQLYTEQEINDAFDQTGYDPNVFEGEELIIRLIEDGVLPDRRALVKTAVATADLEKAAIALNAGAAGTSWCTGASVATAREQINRGDFYIYYKDGKPDVAVRMDGTDKIGEIRGNTPNQWLTPEQQTTAEEFLRSKKFEGAKKFLAETQRKKLLIDFFNGKSVPAIGRYFASSFDKYNKTLQPSKLKSAFWFPTLDGYAASMRPEPSQTLVEKITPLVRAQIMQDLAENRVPFRVSFDDTTEGTYNAFGEKRTVLAKDLISAKFIISGSGEKIVFPKLVDVESVYSFGDIEMPVLKKAEAITFFNSFNKRHNLVLSNKAVIEEINGNGAGKNEVYVSGGFYVRIRPASGFTEVYLLSAKIDAPYVTILPYTGKGTPPSTLPTVKTPNKIADAPPVETAGPAAEDRLLFARAQNMPTAARVANQIVGEQKGWLAKLKDNFLGQGFRMQFVDKYSSAEEVLKRGGADPTKAMQAMYYLRMVDQQMHFTSQAITDGVPERREIIRRDGTKEYLIEAKPGANLKQAYDILKRKDVVKETGGADESNKFATLYMAAIRGERVGYDTLNFGRVWAQGEIKRIENELKSTKLSAEQRTVLTKRMNSLESRLDSMPTPEDFKAAKAEIDANPVLRDAFSEVRDIYNQYNRDLINFNVQTGALSKEQANKLLQENDYIPYYRIRDGVAELMIGKETPIRIGNLKDSPHLQELVGGDEPIMDFIASSVQNTSMLINMAMHNIAMKNLMFEFKDLGLATIGKVKNNNAPTGAVTFKLDGVEHFAVVDTEALGISSDLLVKGLAGIPTMFPAFVRVMGAPARFLRRMIVASPLYMARQLFRDSLAASIASGANTVPILGALKQIGKTDVLERRGITGGQVFTGMPEDQARMIKAMQAGKFSINNGLAYLEGKAAQVDALTRRAQYDSYIQQGLSEMEATYMALESMNFSRRGLSPSVHMASTLIPFLNSQIQGLDVLYRSFRGQMPMNERLGVRRKLIERGMMLAALSFAYAMAMQDDEAYKNAKPEEKYGNWFVSLPGVEQPLRLPIPFELGYVFKALPEALVNILSNEEGGEEAFKALKHIVQQMVPGLSNFFIPAAIKPLAEVGSGVSTYTLRDIESAREQEIEPGYRARESTTELAKAVGQMTGFSPIKLEFLISGYTGQMGMALIAALSAPFAGTGEGPAPATKRPSDLPLIGTLFQPKDASGIIDLVYERMNKVRQVQETYKRLIDENKPEQAKRYAEEKADELSLASVAGAFRQQMGEITKFERDVRASNLTPDQKREALDRARQAKIDLSKRVQALSGRTAPQAARP